MRFPSMPRARSGFAFSVIVVTLYLAWSQTAPATAANKSARATQKVDLTPQITVGSVQQARVLFELDGTLALKSETKDPVKRPVQAKAQFVYEEKVLQGATDSAPWAHNTARYYDTAKATIQISGSKVNPELRSDRRIMAISALSADDVVLFSPLGPLSREELDLVDVPANSAVIDGILPNRTVAVGQSWKVESALLPAILGIDAISSHDVQCTLKSVAKNLAVIHAQGRVSGASGGVASEITLAAKFNFDLTRKRISWFAMSLKENRSVGHAQPGIEATIRVQMALAKRTNSAKLHEEILADLNTKADDASRLLEFTSPSGGFELLIGRDWHEMVERKDVSVLRMVDRGDLIAQCNISRLPPMEDGVPFTLADFQQDVKNVLGDSFGDITNVNEEVNENGLHVMRVVTSGMASDLQIIWVYYHLTNEEGERVSCVFTFEADLADRFGAADQAMLSSFRFHAR